MSTEQEDRLLTLEKHLHYVRVNRVKMREEALPQAEREKYEKRYRNHLRYLARLVLDLSMEGQEDELMASTK